jgi:HicB_like antitoxin of bacterial toxin-antitoxin system
VSVGFQLAYIFDLGDKGFKYPQIKCKFGKDGRQKFELNCFDRKDEDSVFITKVPDIPGCYTKGKTVGQAMERLRDAVQVCLETAGL